jgi:hypothetical protein
MRRVQTIALVAIALLAGFTIYLAVRGRQPPILPDDDEHARFVSAEDCLICHDPDGDSPQAKNHPLGNECLRCHGRP